MAWYWKLAAVEQSFLNQLHSGDFKFKQAKAERLIKNMELSDFTAKSLPFYFSILRAEI